MNPHLYWGIVEDFSEEVRGHLGQGKSQFSMWGGPGRGQQPGGNRAHVAGTLRWKAGNVLRGGSGRITQGLLGLGKSQDFI